MKDVSKLKYVILSGHFPKDPALHALHNKAFLYWKNFWNNVFKENGTNDQVNPDHFWRQDMVTILMNGEDIVALHLYSFFHLKSIAAKNHSYFVEGFNEEYFEKLNKRQGSSVMSLEYLTVAADWRKKDCGISLGSVFVGLACLHQKLHDVSVLIAPARVDVKVDRMMEEYGGEVIVGGLEMHNTPVSLMAIFNDKSKKHPDQNVNSAVEKLWKDRIDYTQADQDTKTKIKKVA